MARLFLVEHRSIAFLFSLDMELIAVKESLDESVVRRNRRGAGDGEFEYGAALVRDFLAALDLRRTQRVRARGCHLVLRDVCARGEGRGDVRVDRDVRSHSARVEERSASLRHCAEAEVRYRAGSVCALREGDAGS